MSASAIVIILILLLAFTVNHAREKDMVEVFSHQQFAHAQNTAIRIADIFTQAGKNLALFSHFDPQKKLSPEEIYGDFNVISSGLEKSVDAIGLFDAEGKIKLIFPRNASPAVNLTSHFNDLKKKSKPQFELTQSEKSPTANFEQSMNSYMIIGCPIRRHNNFSGALIASFSLTAIIEDYKKQATENSLGNLWLTDEYGKIIVHNDLTLIGKNTKDLLQMGPENRIDFSTGHGNHMEAFVRKGDKQTERSIIAYYPVQTGDKKWAVFIDAPYNQVILPVRNTFVYTLFSALLLILVVVVVSMSFAYRTGKMVRIEEELKRVKEREDWQEKLLREKGTIDGIIEGSPIPSFVISREHKVILWNRACAELTGYKASEMVNTDKHYMPFYSVKRPLIADLIVERDLEGLDKFYGTKKVKKSAKVFDAYEATDYFENLGGHSRHLYFLAAPIYDEKGQIIAVIETLQDVSHEQEMARSLREYAESLQNELSQNIELQREIEELNRYLQSMVRSLPEKIYELDSNGIVSYMNKGLEKEGKLSSRDYKGTYFLDFVAPEDKAFVWSKWQETKKGIYEPYEIETTTKNGKKVNLLVTTSPVAGTDHYLLVQRDITEFKDMEQKLYESQKLAALGQLSAGIAHEVRNPLSSIKMSLQILEKRMNPAGNDLKRFKIAEKEVEHLEELVNNILIFAKPLEPKMTPVILTRVLDQAIAMAEKGIADKHIDMQTQYESIPPVIADSAMLVDAFLNIIRNAVEAVEEKGSINISLNYLEGSRKIIVMQIKDNGCGIDASDMPHLFNPFFTRKKYGTGLGLSQVKRIIDLNQGTIDIASEKGKGTIVSVTLPCEERRKSPRLV
ncbi:MAG: ATP-binding protein [Smithellaceae bacterium]